MSRIGKILEARKPHFQIIRDFAGTKGLDQITVDNLEYNGKGVSVRLVDSNGQFELDISNAINNKPVKLKKFETFSDVAKAFKKEFSLEVPKDILSKFEKRK